MRASLRHARPAWRSLPDAPVRIQPGTIISPDAIRSTLRSDRPRRALLEEPTTAPWHGAGTIVDGRLHAERFAMWAATFVGADSM